MNRLELYTLMLEVATSHTGLSLQDILTKTRINYQLPFISLSELIELDLNMLPVDSIEQAVKKLSNEGQCYSRTCKVLLFLLSKMALQLT